MADPARYPGAPRWVKVSGVIAIVLALFVLVVLVSGGGPHGPARHASAVQAPWGVLLLLLLLVVAAIALNWTGRWPGGVAVSGERPSLAFTPGVRKFVLASHVAVSVATLGAVAGFLAFSIAGLASSSGQTVRAVYVAMELTARYVILPLLLASLFTGIIQALGTTWGLFRHYWVLTKLLLTLLVAVVLLLQMDGISHMARVAVEMPLSGTDFLALRRSLRTHAAGGLLVLLIPVALSIYKPRGMTPYGWRREQA